MRHRIQFGMATVVWPKNNNTQILPAFHHDIDVFSRMLQFAESHVDKNRYYLLFTVMKFIIFFYCVAEEARLVIQNT